MATDAAASDSNGRGGSGERPAAKPIGRFAAIVRALRHRNFQLFFAGQLISLVGTWMQSVAEAWLVYRLTGSSLMLGLVAFASQIPVFLVSPLGGTVVDRHNRHRVVIMTQTTAMLLAFYAALTLGHWIRVWEVVVLARRCSAWSTRLIFPPGKPFSSRWSARKT